MPDTPIQTVLAAQVRRHTHSSSNVSPYLNCRCVRRIGRERALRVQGSQRTRHRPAHGTGTQRQAVLGERRPGAHRLSRAHLCRHG